MLSKKTKYAIKALIFLGRSSGNMPVHVTDIASKENIPHKYLGTIMAELRNAGLIYSKKGAGGGYLLSRKPEEIPLVKILRITDGPIAMVSCASLNYYHKCEECLNEENCGIRQTFIRVRDANLEILLKTTIADLLAKEGN